MAEKATVAALDPIDVVERAKDFWARFSNIIIYTGSGVIILLLSWLAYKNFVKIPNEDKANDLLFPTERIFDKMTQAGFSKDSINFVLNGGNGVTGVLKIANNYGSTPAGNRANLIAGACYLHSGDFANAVKHLKEFSTKATQVQTAADLMLGDAYSELKNNDEALDAYKKAASVNDKDEFMAPEALYREGLFAETIGKTDVAIDCYQKIKDNYPKSAHAAAMDKYLARLGVVNN